jgi:RNA polymerase sigma-70 factor, ECF subfamily
MEAPDAEIIAAVLNGDVSAFEPLVVKYQPRVFATARRYARRESEVEDIVQEVFIKAFQKLASFRGEAPFEHWLMRVAVRTCYDFLRKHQRNRESALAELSDEEDRWLDSVASSPAGQNDDSDAARALVGQLLN